MKKWLLEFATQTSPKVPFPETTIIPGFLKEGETELTEVARTHTAKARI